MTDWELETSIWIRKRGQGQFPLRAIASPYQPAAVSQSLCLRLGLLDGHPVLYTLHTVYIVGEFGGQVQFVCVAGLDLPPFLYPMDDGIS